MTDTENVGVDCHCSFVEYHTLNYICGFSSYSGEFYQFFQSSWNFTLKVFYQHLSHSYQMLGFVVWIAYTTYVFVNYLRGGVCQNFGSWKCRKKRRSYHIDTLVCTLRT